jgi:hypothetical protein
MSIDSDEGSIEHGHIELLAYAYWLERGRPFGSPEVDWLHAVETLRAGGALDLPLSAFHTTPSE